MSRLIFILLFILVIVGGGLFIFSQKTVDEIAEMTKTSIMELINLNKETKLMKITSPLFQNNEFIPAKYTCDGEDVSPPLLISEVPENTQSLVLISDDPDAPAGTWVHWTVWNIDPKISEISESSVPAGAVEGMTSFGSKGYGGPCPPSGTHRYFFKLYALDLKLDLSSDADKTELEKAMEGHILAKTELIGLYKRQ